MDTDLQLAKHVLDWWFSPWGAAKSEDLVGDTEMSPAKLRKVIYRILDGDPDMKQRVITIFGPVSPISYVKVNPKQ